MTQTVAQYLGAGRRNVKPSDIKKWKKKVGQYVYTSYPDAKTTDQRGVAYKVLVLNVEETAFCGSGIKVEVQYIPCDKCGHRPTSYAKQWLDSAWFRMKRND